MESPKSLSELLPQYQRSLDQLRDTFKGYEKIQQELTKRSIGIQLSDFIDLHKEMNFSGFLTISMLDNIILLNGISKTTDISQKRYFFKQSYLLIYEVLRTYDIHNKVIKSLIAKKFPELEEWHSIVAKDIKLFKAKKNYSNHIVNIRNSIAGHIESNFSMYYDTISSLKEETVTDLLEEFGDLLTKIKKFSTELAKLSHGKLDENLNKIDVEIKSKFKLK